jgi:hypothetical protein
MLITANEVRKYAPVQQDYPTGSWCEQIDFIEEDLFDDCNIGLNYYEQLIDDLNNTDVDQYLFSVTYNLGDRCHVNSVIYISLIDNNDVNPIDDSKENPKWRRQPKFVTPENEIIFKKLIGPWLAISIVYRTIRYETYRAGGQGLIKITPKFSESGIETLELAEFNEWKKELKIDAERLYLRLAKYLADRNAPNESDNCDGGICKPTKKSSKRFYFRK